MARVETLILGARELKHQKIYVNIAGLTFENTQKWAKASVDTHNHPNGVIASYFIKNVVSIKTNGCFTIGFKYEKEVFRDCYIPAIFEQIYREPEATITFSNSLSGPIIEIKFNEDKIVDGELKNFAYIKFED